MKQTAFYLLILLAFNAPAQNLKVIQLEELTTMINQPSKQLKVFNFWASWCGPCINELPFFDQLDKDKVEVLLVSLDHPEDIEKARKMITKKEIKSNTYLLNEKDTDKYMRAISIDWSGAIPATLFVDSRGNKYFYEQAFDQQELNTTIAKYIR